MDSRTVIRLLEAEGSRLLRINGSHHQFRHPEKLGTVTVAHPRKDVARGTLRSIERQAGTTYRR